mgnify:CR=1 FL=1
MIYKFIDNNGSEIAVNSLSSLQALVESETIKEDTKIKAGLRGKWTTASKINELVFHKEETPEPEESKEDIKSFITKESPIEEVKEAPKEEVKEAPKEEVKEAPKEEVKAKEQKEESTKDTSDYYSEVFAKKDDNEDGEEENEVVEEEKLEEVEELEEDDKNDFVMKKRKRSEKSKYDDDNVIGLSFFQSIGTCFKKYFTANGRASRSEYWFFQLFFIILSIPAMVFDENSTNDTYLILIIVSFVAILILFIPNICVSIRRLHDLNKTGWLILLSLIPFIGGLILFVMLIAKGTEGKNKFGNYPLKFKKNS